MTAEILKALERGAVSAAPVLLGTTLIHDLPEGTVAAKIVEVEAYHQTDPASHTFRGRTPRNSSMFLSAGHLYVYFTYGMHWCANVVAGKEGLGEGILLRAAEPVLGIDIMTARRQTAINNLTNGPAKLTQAFGIAKAQDGTWLGEGTLRLEGEPYTGNFIAGPRIGINQGTEEHLRFWIPDSPFVSK